MVFVYGAYGFTGQMLCKMLAEEGIPLIISGRNKQKLEKLKEKIGKKGKGKGIEVLPASLDELSGISVYNDISLVINTAGPFTETGEKVVQFALRHNVPYIDCSGEANHALNIKEKYGQKFAEKGIFASVGVSWETVSGETSVKKLVKKTQKFSRIYLVYLADFSMSPGTLQSSLYIIRNGALKWRKGELMKGRVGEIKFEFELKGKRFLGLNISSADILNVPLSLGETGTNIDFDVLFATSWRRAKTFSVLLRLLEVLLKSKLAFRFLEDLLDRVPPPTEKKSRASAISFALDENGDVVDSFSLDAKKPYFITAKILKHACQEFLAGKTKGKKGYLPPTSVFSFPENVFES